MSLVPAWIRTYDRRWLLADVVAGIAIGSIVVPQAVAYAQIAGLPPEAGLMAAPGALIGYALLGSSRSLVVGATTATAAVSAAAVAPLAGGDPARFAALSATLALVVALVFATAGALRLGAFADFISTAAMTGFLFGLGLTIAVGQLPAFLGIEPGDGEFFGKAWDALSSLGDVHGGTLAVGVASAGLLVVLRRLAPAAPATLVLLVVAIAVSALAELSDHGVAAVGEVPRALPDPTWPDVSLGDIGALVPVAFGVLLASTEAIGVSRSFAAEDGYRADVNRDLVGIGGGNLLAGLSGGFVQSGGASQTAAGHRAGGRSQLASVIAAALVLLTGAFLAPLFEDLPQATLAAIVIVAVAGFFRVGELRRFARLRRDSTFVAFAGLTGVLLLGVVPGLIVTMVLTLALLVRWLSRPRVDVTRREDDEIVALAEGPIFYANAVAVTERVIAAAQAEDPPPRAVVLDLGPNFDVDIETIDSIAALRRSLEREGIALELTGLHPHVRELLTRAGVREITQRG